MNRKFILNSGEIAGGASKLMLDVFNAVGSGDRLKVLAIYILPKTDVAVTGVVSARFDLFRTSAVGTSGQNIGYNASSSSTATISSLDSENAGFNTRITARTAPGGGATISTWITSDYAFPEETTASSLSNNYFNILGEAAPLVINQGQGLLIKQGSVASVNSYMFKIVFELETVQ